MTEPVAISAWFANVANELSNWQTGDLMVPVLILVLGVALGLCHDCFAGGWLAFGLSYGGANISGFWFRCHCVIASRYFEPCWGTA